MKVLVTGTAGFIGFHLVKYLLARGDEVVGIDNINNYYDVKLKCARLRVCGIGLNPDDTEDGEMPAYNKLIRSQTFSSYRFIRLNLEDKDTLYRLFADEHFDAVCHLAAQAGVRYSLTEPHTYVSSNITGFLNILEACRHNTINNLCYASSSSVYGLNTNRPFSVHDNVDHPVSLYAASKKANELMAHTYSHLFGVPTSGLRFFTVYGPWGRPDMALFKFVQNILAGKPIDIYNYGNMRRDFTYIDDIIEGLVRVIDHPATVNPAWDSSKPDAASSSAPYRIYNLGKGRPDQLLDFIAVIEEILGKKAQKNLLPMQPGDIAETFADTMGLEQEFGYKPVFDIRKGIMNFIEWFRAFYKI